MPDLDLTPPPSIFKSDLGKSDWSDIDRQRQLSYLLLHGVDWAQTRTIAKNPEKHGEMNPILGEHPSVGKVNNYFLTTAILHALAANYLPPEYRKWFQRGTIGLEAGVTGRNKFKLGIGMTF